MLPVSDIIPPRRVPVVTVALIAANTLTFACQLAVDRHQLYDLARSFGLTPAHPAWPTLLTAPFLHQGWIEYIISTGYLWLFGPNVEDTLGRAVYLGFYLGLAAVAGLVHVALHPASVSPLIGASSVVAGVMGAYCALFPRSQVLLLTFVLHLEAIEVPALFFIGAWPVLQLMTSLAPMAIGTADVSQTLGAQAAAFTVGLAVGMVGRRDRRWGQG